MFVQGSVPGDFREGCECHGRKLVAPSPLLGLLEESFSHAAALMSGMHSDLIDMRGFVDRAHERVADRLAFAVNRDPGATRLGVTREYFNGVRRVVGHVVVTDGAELGVCGYFHLLESRRVASSGWPD